MMVYVLVNRLFLLAFIICTFISALDAQATTTTVQPMTTTAAPTSAPTTTTAGPVTTTAGPTTTTVPPTTTTPVPSTTNAATSTKTAPPTTTTTTAAPSTTARARPTTTTQPTSTKGTECEDTFSECDALKPYCKIGEALLREKHLCDKTCGFCGISASPITTIEMTTVGPTTDRITSKPTTTTTKPTTLKPKKTRKTTKTTTTVTTTTRKKPSTTITLTTKVKGPCTKEAERIQVLLSGPHEIADLFPPSCNADGTYEEVQCHPMTGCWCVTKDGKHIRGTTTHFGPPNCNVSLAGGWSDWGPWGKCFSFTFPIPAASELTTKIRSPCEGTQLRGRYCNNPSPTNGGTSCTGPKYDYRKCKLQCQVDGGWSAWGPFTACRPMNSQSNAPFCMGVQASARICDNPTPANGGLPCPGPLYKYKACVASCKDETDVGSTAVDGAWSQWTSYGPCSVPCGIGKRSRYRFCNSPTPQNGGASCAGTSREVSFCVLPSCLGAFAIPGYRWNILGLIPVKK